MSKPPSVPLSVIAEADAAGWPEPGIHPEDYCHVCGHANMFWYVDRDVWLAATSAWAAETGKQGICCPRCFADMHEQQTGEWTIWKLVRVPEHTGKCKP